MQFGRYLALCFIVLLSGLSHAQMENFGRFQGEAVLMMLPDGRNMRLVNPLSYIDPNGQSWDVPAGTETDGASIPRVLWLTHPPFTGKYRLAAVIHDYYCHTQLRSWRDTHQAFYSAMRATGVVETTAKVMYAAVYIFGPRWGIGEAVRGPGEEQYPTIEKQTEFIRDLEAWVGRAYPSLEELEKVLDQGAIPK